MIKIKNLTHTILHFILWIFFVVILIFNTKPSYYEGWSLSETTINNLRFFSFMLFLYLSSGVLFDITIYSLEKKGIKNPTKILRISLIILSLVISFYLFYIINALSG